MNQTKYEAFGNLASSSGQSQNNRLANTKERDFSIGLDNHGFRYYDPEVGRYTTRDPIGYASGTLNIYVYVGNNPPNQHDPLGLRNKVSVDEKKREIVIKTPLRFRFYDKGGNVVRKPEKWMKEHARALAAHLTKKWSGMNFGDYSVRIDIAVDFWSGRLTPEGKETDPREGGYNVVDIHWDTEPAWGKTDRWAGEATGTEHTTRPVDEEYDRKMSVNMLSPDDARKLIRTGKVDAVNKVMTSQYTTAVHEFGHILGLGDEYLSSDLGTYGNPSYPSDSLYNAIRTNPARWEPFAPRAIYQYHINRIVGFAIDPGVQRVVRSAINQAANNDPTYQATPLAPQLRRREAGWKGQVGF